MVLKLTLSIVRAGVWESTASLRRGPFGAPFRRGCVGWCRTVVGASVFPRVSCCVLCWEGSGRSHRPAVVGPTLGSSGAACGRVRVGGHPAPSAHCSRSAVASTVLSVGLPWKRASRRPETLKTTDLIRSYCMSEPETLKKTSTDLTLLRVKEILHVKRLHK